MATTIEELERRVAALEQELAAMRQREERRVVEETSAQRGARLLREAKASQAAISALTAKVFAEMGITGEPVPPEQLRQMMIEGGVNPEDNAASREIITMREE